MKIEFRPKFVQKVLTKQGSYQIIHEDLVMTVLKGDDVLDFSKAPFLVKKHGWYSHIYTHNRCYTGMSGNGMGVLNRTRKHLDPKNTVEYKDGIQTVIVLTCRHRDLSTDVLYALEHTFTQLSGFSVTHTDGVRNATGTHFNLKDEDDVYDWARSYAIYATMFKQQGFTQYTIALPSKPSAKGSNMFQLEGCDVVIENTKKKNTILAGSKFLVPTNIIVEYCTYTSMFNELVKSNVVLPVYNEQEDTIELLFMKDYQLNKRFSLDELSSLFLDELVNDSADKWKNNTISLKTYLHGNNTSRVTKR